METKSYKNLDRSGWHSGEWDNEPDKMQWPDEATGLPCLAVRQKDNGHWCGYVGVTEEHPKFSLGYSEVDAEVHGGLTYADACQPRVDESRGICHTPPVGEPDHVWWFGFDCAHAWDYSPGERTRIREADQTYRTLDYVRENCRGLAKQLRAMK